MKRDINLSQLALFEPGTADALQIMEAQQKLFEVRMNQADLWEAVWCPGARDEALRQASDAFASWLHAAFFLDLEREAGL